MYVYVCVSISVCMKHSAHMEVSVCENSTHLEVRRQPVGISSRLLPCVFTESDSVVRLGANAFTCGAIL